MKSWEPLFGFVSVDARLEFTPEKVLVALLPYFLDASQSSGINLVKHCTHILPNVQQLFSGVECQALAAACALVLVPGFVVQFKQLGICMRDLFPVSE